MKVPQWVKVAVPAAILLLLALWVRWVVSSAPPQSTMSAASFYGLSKQEMIERLGQPLTTNRVGDAEEGWSVLYGYEDGTLFVIPEGTDRIDGGMYKRVPFNKAGSFPVKRQ
jgi:hypothetical protein